ncbi:MAG: hypothetical protein FJ098_01725 [Deltaproteobacteria bacterium]|nr:hypothetical protein [Deltaproteobacteria bacterium]
MTRPTHLPAVALLLAGCLLPSAALPSPEETARSLDAALLRDDPGMAWRLAEDLAVAPPPWDARGVGALAWLSGDLARCGDGGRLPALDRLLEHPGVPGWLRWAAWDIALENLLRCRAWEEARALANAPLRPGPWTVEVAASASGLADAFFRIRSWRPPAGAPRSAAAEPRWSLRTTGRLFAAAETCLDRPGRYAVRLDTRAAGTLWLDGRLVLLAEPGTRLDGEGPRAVAEVDLTAGCHAWTLGLATPPGWGSAVLRLLPCPQARSREDTGAPEEASARMARAWGALLRGDLLAAEDLVEGLDAADPAMLLFRFRAETIQGRDAPLEALVAAATLPGRAGEAPPCLLWRKRMEDALQGGDAEARLWLEIWPETCRETPPARLTMARGDAEAGRTDEAAAAAADVARVLGTQGLVSCVATVTAAGAGGPREPGAPRLLDAVPFCRDAAFADTAAHGRPEDAARMAELLDSLPGPPGPSPGLRPLARRLAATGRGEQALALLEDTSWQDPELLWLAADLQGGEPGSAALDRVTDAELATTDLRGREGMIRSWAELEAAACSVEDTIETYRGSGWGSGPSVLVLDETIVRTGPGSRVSVLTTRVHHLRSRQAAQDWTDLEVPEGAQVLRLRVMKPDGSWREPPALGPGDLASLGELTEDDVVVSQLVEELEPEVEVAGGYCLPSVVLASRDLPVWRSRLVVLDGPGRPLVATRTGAAPAPRDLDSRTRLFEAWRQDPAPEEEEAPHWDAGLPRVDLCTRGFTWPVLRMQLADGLLGRITPDASLRRLAHALATSPDPRAAAFDASVRGIAPADESFFQRSAAEILADREGSPAVLLLALLTDLGEEATLLLVDPPGGAALLPLAPDPGVHSVPVVRVTLPDGTFLWLDPFGPGARFGELRPFLGGRPGLLLDGDAGNLWEQLPAVPPRRHRVEVDWDGRVDRDLGARATLAVRFTGLAAAGLSERLRRASPEDRDEAVASFARRFLEASHVTGYTTSQDREGLEFRIQVRLPPGALGAPTLLRLGTGELRHRYASRSRRTQPLLLEGEAFTAVRVRMEAPAGYALVARGDGGRVATDFGLHELRWTGGARLEVRHVSFLADQVLQPPRYAELVRFVRAADGMDRLLLTLEPAP